MPSKPAAMTASKRRPTAELNAQAARDQRLLSQLMIGFEKAGILVTEQMLDVADKTRRNFAKTNP